MRWGGNRVGPSWIRFLLGFARVLRINAVAFMREREGAAVNRVRKKELRTLRSSFTPAVRIVFLGCHSRSLLLFSSALSKVLPSFTEFFFLSQLPATVRSGFTGFYWALLG